MRVQILCWKFIWLCAGSPSKFQR